MRPAHLLAASCLVLLAPQGAFAQPAPLSSYWPHEDGRLWFYDQRHEELLNGGGITDSQAKLWFEGTTVAPGGIDAQVLWGSVASLPAARAVTVLDAGIPSEVRDPLLRRLWIARPDLRPGILRNAATADCPTQAIPDWWPLLLTGGLAYVQTASEVAAWRCDVPSTRAWLWLTSDLTPGNTATLQLIPDLTDDVTLRLTVLGLVDATVPGGMFHDCLHVDYVIDYGTSECTDDSGNPIGTSGYETRGFVRYAPGVGPIECLEEFGIADATGTCDSTPWPIARSTLKLNAPSVPAKASSWGRVKSAYRQ